jgi:Fe-S-cluster-containing dehydrogenase component
MSGLGFVLDLDRCVGCEACVMACRIENRWADGSPWRRVLSLNLPRVATGPTYFLSLACHHCESPACLRACPSRAYVRRSDGVVRHLDERCLGCRYCEMACPFGAPRFSSETGLVSKCHLCFHRLDRGEAPACVAACPTLALRLPTAEEIEAPASWVPGFTDPAGCRPRIRLLRPRRGQRQVRLADLERQRRS